FGARGDGQTIDSDAINKAVDAAAAAGGGFVDLPAGRDLRFSIWLKSHVTLRFSPGAVIVAGGPGSGVGRYDLPAENPNDLYQDFGHSHWQNSLISGIDVEEYRHRRSGPDRRAWAHARRPGGPVDETGQPSVEHGQRRRRRRRSRGADAHGRP